MGQVLAICDYERQYVFRLAEFLNGHKLLPFEVMAFDDPCKLVAYGKSNRVAVLLIDETMITQLPEQFPVQQTISLVSNQGVQSDEYPSILKYQSAVVIAKCILEICSSGQADYVFSELRTQKARLIGVYSPINRCLKTSFSIVLGQLLAKKKRCLYINLEPYSGFSQLLDYGATHGNLSQLLFYLENHSKHFQLKMKSMIEQFGNLDYIPPTENFLDLQDVTTQTWLELIETIRSQSEYEIIILDLSDYIHGLFELLSKCDHVYTIVRKDGMSLAKIDQYEKMLAFTNQSALLEKTKKIQLPIYKQLPKKISELPYSELALYVNRLIEEDCL